MTTLAQVTTAQANKETTINNNFTAVLSASFGGYKASTSAGLTWGYYGGNIMVAGVLTAIADGTLSLGNNATNYIVASLSTGAISSNTSGFGTDTPLYQVVTSGGVVTSITDKRSAIVPIGTGSVVATAYLQSKYPVAAPFLEEYMASGGGIPSATPIASATGLTNILDAVWHPNGRWIYAADQNNPAKIYQYSVNQDTGALTSIAAAISIGNTGEDPYVDPTGRFLYVPCLNSNNIYGFTINQSTGALTAITGSPWTVGTTPVTVVADAQGRWLYSSNTGSSSMYGFSINQSTGALTALAGAPFAAPAAIWGIDSDPTGRFVFTSHNGAGTISSWSVNQTTGIPTLVTSGLTTGGSQPLGVCCDPTGRFVYCPNNTNGTMAGFVVNESTGALTAMSGSPFTVTGVAGGAYPSTDPRGLFLYCGFGSGVFSYAPINQFSGVPGPFNTSISLTQASTVRPDLTGRFFLWTNNTAGSLNILRRQGWGICDGVVTGVLQNYGGIIAGDPGTEGTGINVGGTTYDSLLKVVDLTTSDVAMFILNRHSTTLEALVVGARSHSSGSSHSAVLAADGLLSIYAVGYGATAYQLGGIMRFAVTQNGTDTNMPTSWTLSLSAVGSVAPAAVITANPDKSVVFASNITIGDATALIKTSVAMNNGAGANTATLTNAPAATNPTKWVPMNDNGTVRYIPAW